MKNKTKNEIIGLGLMGVAFFAFLFLVDLGAWDDLLEMRHLEGPLGIMFSWGGYSIAFCIGFFFLGYSLFRSPEEKNERSEE